MYGVIRTYRVTDVEELSRRVRDEFVPVVRDVTGFIDYYVIDGGDGTVSSVTITEDKTGADESITRAADWIKDRIAPLIESGPDIIAGEVTVERSRARTTA